MGFFDENNKANQEPVSHERRLELIEYKASLVEARYKQETIISYHVLVFGVLAVLVFFISKDFFTTGTYKDLFYYGFILSAVFSLVISVLSSIWSNHVHTKVIDIVDFSLEKDQDPDDETRFYINKGGSSIRLLNALSYTFCVISLLTLWIFIISFMA